MTDTKEGGREGGREGMSSLPFHFFPLGGVHKGGREGGREGRREGGFEDALFCQWLE